MRELILAGFDGNNNPARTVTEKVNCDCRKIILPNNREEAASMLLSEISRESTACVVMLGQKPCIRDKAAVEPCASLCGETLRTNMDVTVIRDMIRDSGYNAYISRGCGNSYCNHVYFECLKSGVNCVFLHVPCADNISDMSALIRAIEELLNNIAAVPAALAL